MTAWLLVLRPKTLSGAAAPVLLALACAWHQGAWLWVPAVLCLAFALLMQMLSNVVNDLVDGLHNRDGAGRLGPPRAFTSGQISLRGMKMITAVLTIGALVVGLPLMWWGGYWMLAVGVACLLFAVLYSVMLAQMGMGDLLVLVFFGLVPVVVTFYLQTGYVNLPVVLLGLAMGMVTDTLLIVNNYRDIYQDKKNGKHTLCVFLGLKGSLRLYFCTGFVATAIAMVALWLLECRAFGILFCLYFPLHILAFKALKRMLHTHVMNKALGHAARNILVFALAASLALILK